MKILFFFLLVLFPQWVLAGGPFYVTSDGAPIVWDTSSAIPLHPESGTCADFSNGDMLAKIATNIAYWELIDGIDLEFDVEAGEIGEDIDGDNYTDYLVDSSDDAGLVDNLNPVMFDDDGEIVVAVFGDGNQFAVLGFAGPDGFSDDATEYTDGQALFNCLCLAGNENNADCQDLGVTFSEDDLDFTMTHEIGHMIGFDHTQVNQAMADASSCDTATSGDCDDIPVMYPVAWDSADQITPTVDDKVIALTLYGQDGWEDDFCTVTGALTDADSNELRCADVQALTDDTADTVAVVSGAFAPAEDTDGDGYTDGDGECTSDCGSFTLYGLDPDKTYTLTVKPVDSGWTGGSGIGPCSTQNEGVVEEEITTVEGCTAGATEELGTIQTESSGGTSNQEDDSSDDSGSDGSSDSSSEDTCGVDQDFTTCDPMISCSLSDQPVSARHFLLIILLPAFLLLCRSFSCLPPISSCRPSAKLPRMRK